MKRKKVKTRRTIIGIIIDIIVFLVISAFVIAILFGVMGSGAVDVIFIIFLPIVLGAGVGFWMKRRSKRQSETDNGGKSINEKRKIILSVIATIVLTTGIAYLSYIWEFKDISGTIVFEQDESICIYNLKSHSVEPLKLDGYEKIQNVDNYNDGSYYCIAYKDDKPYAHSVKSNSVEAAVSLPEGEKLFKLSAYKDSAIISYGNLIDEATYTYDTKISLVDFKNNSLNILIGNNYGTVYYANGDKILYYKIIFGEDANGKINYTDFVGYIYVLENGNDKKISAANDMRILGWISDNEFLYENEHTLYALNVDSQAVRNVNRLDGDCSIFFLNLCQDGSYKGKYMLCAYNDCFLPEFVPTKMYILNIETGNKMFLGRFSGCINQPAMGNDLILDWNLSDL